MKRRYTYIPLINLEETFREYCKKNYIKFLQSSNQKGFKERLDKIDNEDQAIDKFVRMNINRLYLFIDDLFDEDHIYDASYARSYIYKNIPLIEKNYTELNYLSNFYRTFIVKFLHRKQIIECDYFYISQNAPHTSKTKNYSYRVHPRLYSSDVEWYRKRLEIIDRLYNTYHNKITYEPKLSEHLKRIKSMMQDWKIDVDSVPEKYTAEIHQYHKKKDEDYFKQCIGKRIYTAELVSLRKEMRKNLYVHSPYEIYKQIEMSNAYHYFLSVLFINQELDLSETELKVLDDFAFMLRSSERKDEVIYCLTKLIPHILDDYNFKDVLDELCDLNPRLQIIDLDLLTELFNDQQNREYYTYICLSASGMIYDVIIDIIGIPDRAEFKDKFNKFFNRNNDVLLASNDKMISFFRSHFPTIFKFAINLKNYTHNNFYYVITRLETELLRDNVASKLLDDDQHFIVIHDGIMVIDSEAVNTQKLINSTAYKLYGLTPHTRIEELDGVTENQEKRDVNISCITPPGQLDGVLSA